MAPLIYDGVTLCQPQYTKIISFMYDGGMSRVYSRVIKCAFANGPKVLRTRFEGPKTSLRTATYGEALKGAEILGLILVRERTQTVCVPV